MKELSVEEVLRIAGGLPVPAALDEITYQAAAECAADVLQRPHLPPTSQETS